MRPLLLILVLALPATAQTLEYDKFTGLDYYKSKRIEIYRNKGGVLAYNPARVQVQAVKALRKPTYTLLIDVDSYDWQFINDCTIRVLADDHQLAFPCTVTNSHAYTLARSVYVTESLSVSVPAGDYTTMMNAKIVEMRAGAYEFKIKEKHLKELKSVIIPEVTTSQ